MMERSRNLLNCMHSSKSSQVRLWLITGPLILLLAFTLIIFNSPLPLSPLLGGALLAFPLCLIWKKQGLWLSLALLLIAFLFTFYATSAQERVWPLAMTIVLGLGMVLTFLALEEVDHAFVNFQDRSEQQIEYVRQLERKLAATEESWWSERSDLTKRIAELLKEKEKHAGELLQAGELIKQSHGELDRHLTQKLQIMKEHQQKEKMWRMWQENSSTELANLMSKNRVLDLLLEEKEEKLCDLGQLAAKLQEEQAYHQKLLLQKENHVSALQEKVSEEKLALEIQETQFKKISALLQQQLKHMEEKKSGFENELSELNSSLKSYESSFKDLENAANGLREDNTAYQKLLEEKVTLLNSLEEKVEKQKQGIAELQSEHAKDRFNLQHQLEVLTTHKSEIERQLTAATLAIKNKEESVIRLEKSSREISEAKEHCQKLFEEKNALFEDMKNQVEELNRQLEKLETEKSDLEQQSNVLRSSQSEAVKVPEEKHKEFADLYKQLKVQFEEKNKVLSTTRSELFKLEMKYLALERNKEERERSRDFYQEKLIADVNSLEEQCEQWEKEVDHLQAMIDQLLLQI